jgi:hypothetical protein
MVPSLSGLSEARHFLDTESVNTSDTFGILPAVLDPLDIRGFSCGTETAVACAKERYREARWNNLATSATREECRTERRRNALPRVSRRHPRDCKLKRLLIVSSLPSDGYSTIALKFATFLHRPNGRNHTDRPPENSFHEGRLDKR